MKASSTKFKAIISLLLCTIMVASFTVGCNSNSDTVVTDTTTSTTVNDKTTTEVTTEVPSSDTNIPDDKELSEEISKSAEDTSEAVANGESIDTQVVVEGSIVDENAVENEEALEPDAQVEIENTSYDGDTKAGEGLRLLGSYTGITYFNQADPRWANRLYTSTGNRSQTMKSSACGPTSAAMIVSSSKGSISPVTMAQLFVDKGYRTANNGTAWSCWAFVADYFDFDEYYSTSSYSRMISYLKTDKNRDGISDYFVVVSCNPGLFTTGGHYIVLIQFNGKIVVYDPGLYAGKFNTSSRRAAGVVVSGNSAYVTEYAFKRYGNAQNFWIYSNDHEGKATSNTKPVVSSVKYTRYVSTSSSPLNVRTSPSTVSSIKGSLKKGTKVTVTKISGAWSYITSPMSGWTSSQYLSSSKVTSTSTSTVASKAYSTKVGSTYKLKSATTLYSKGNLTGTKYQYRAKTSIKVLSHYSTTVDYVYVPATGRYAYCKTSEFTSSSGTSTNKTVKYKTVVGKHYRLKSDTVLYSKGNLTGTKYQYRAKTEIVVISHYSTTVDKVKVVKTGRVAHARVSDYK